MRVGEQGYLVRTKIGGNVAYHYKRRGQPFQSLDVVSAYAKRLGGEVVTVEIRVVGAIKVVPDQVTNQG